MINILVLAFSGICMCTLGFVGAQESMNNNASLIGGFLSGLCIASGIILFTMI